MQQQQLALEQKNKQDVQDQLTTAQTKIRDLEAKLQESECTMLAMHAKGR